jgi:hypothetical protein
MLASASAESALPTSKSETRIEIALLVSALFLQRFSLPFQHTFLSLDIVPVVFILSHQFLSGKLLIQLDRLWWFLAAGLAVTFSLLLNFKSTMLTSYFLFLALYSLTTLSRPTSPERYKSVLQSFQILIQLLCCLAIVQFLAQFVVDGTKLIMFYGMVPDFLLGVFHGRGMNTVHLIEGSHLLKSNALFLAEPSTLSQITAVSILIEVLEFRRPRYLIVLVLGFLTSYSGTGMMALLALLPLTGLRDSRAGLCALFVVVCALALLGAGAFDASVFVSRVGEFQDKRASGYDRFVAPLLMIADQFDTASLRALLVGNGPGTAKTLANVNRWVGASPSGWLKWMLEYGIIGSFVFVCFCVVSLRRSRCPRLVLVGLIFIEICAVGFLNTWLLIVIMVLCTLHTSEPTRARVEVLRSYPGRSSAVPGIVPEMY